MLLQNLKDRVSQIPLSPKLNVVSVILGNLAEEFIQILSQFSGREAVILGMVFLLEDDSI